jgi:acetolactate synthase-1/2/3 large subunit
VVDAGNAAAALTRDLPLGPGSTFLMALGMGGMGYSFGAALGAHYANGLPTIVFAGDGAFFMHGSEIHTALEENAPILFVIADNRAHGMCVTRDQIFFGAGDDRRLNRFGRTELGAGLQALYPKLQVERATTAAALDQAVLKLRDRQGPAALVLELETDEMPPFRPFLDEINKAVVTKLNSEARVAVKEVEYETVATGS